MRTSTLVMLALSVFAGTASAQVSKPSAYPAKGQNAERQHSDDTQCLSWAKQSTGIDPATIAATPAAPTGPQGERVAGAARGALAGAVVGEIANGDASKGAGIGAVAGVVGGGMRSRHKQAAQAEQAQASKSAAWQTYYKAYGACMEGRGYTVN